MLDAVLEFIFDTSDKKVTDLTEEEHYQKQKCAIFLLSKTRSSCQDEFSLHGKHFFTITPSNTSAGLKNGGENTRQFICGEMDDGAHIWSYTDIVISCVIQEIFRWYLIWHIFG